MITRSSIKNLKIYEATVVGVMIVNSLNKYEHDKNIVDKKPKALTGTKIVNWHY